jgi:hypothetical protein
MRGAGTPLGKGLGMVARRLLPLLAFFLPLLASRPARADAWFGWGDNALEDRLADGDLDVEDLVKKTKVARSRDSSQEVRAGTWLSLGVMYRVVNGKQDVAGVALLAMALDKLGQGKVHGLSAPEARDAFAASPLGDGTAPASAKQPPAPAAAPSVPAPPPPPATPAPPAPAPLPPLQITPAIARRAVAAAWKASGLGVDDARIDALVARSRLSAALPETRMRVMKVLTDSSKLGVIPTDTSTYDLAGANLYLEARFTWRLDRLLYADDEPTLERTRLERTDARERLSGKVIDSLFQWQRAVYARHGALEGTKEAIDAAMRLAEAEAALDVLTGGWFGRWVARQKPAQQEEAEP